jgi:hypothetical protein
LIMLTFWGRWRMRYTDMHWHTPYKHVFNDNFKHDRTKAPIRLVHTTGVHKPGLPESRYHVFDRFTKALAASLLECPAILAVG